VGRLLTACLVATCATFAIASTASAQAPRGDSVTAAASVGFGTVGVWGFQIDARSGPSGESPTGTIRANQFVLGTYDFSVSCLTVSGNRAAMLGTWIPPTPAPPPPPPGFSYPTVIVVEVEDNGGTADDRLEFGIHDFPFPSPGPPPTGCPITAAELRPLRGGDVTVTDVPPLPTSKEQCKDGGWRDYGGLFKNQGACVAFVQRGPR
jgi:hypothetical protein